MKRGGCMKTMMTYALKNGVLTHISMVDGGLKCDCICPNCNSKLIANKGKVKSHYFSHYNSEECIGGYQTSLHLLAKEIIAEDKYFLYPAYELNYNQNYTFIKIPAKKQKIYSVEVESKTGDIIPDIIINFGTRKLIVEIFVTHKIDEEKLKKIKFLGMSAVEIDLSKINRTITKEELRDILHNDCKYKKWIYNDKFNAIMKWIYSQSEKYRITHTRTFKEWIFNCPFPRSEWKGRYYSELLDDCWQCPYYLDVEINHDYENRFVYCFAENASKVYELEKILNEKYK